MRVGPDDHRYAERDLPDKLTSFIQYLDADVPSSVLIELAEDHVAVHVRLVRLQLSSQPKALATVFRRKPAGVEPIHQLHRLVARE
jgi:hypothetical protein